MMFGITQAVKPRIWRDLYRHFRNFKYEMDDNGDVLIAKARIRGVYSVHTPDGLGVTCHHNLWTTQGLNYLLSAGIGNGTRYTTFYLAPFSGTATLTVGLTAADFYSTMQEITTSFTQGARVAFVESVPASGASNNTGNEAVFTTNTDSVTVTGCGLLSGSTANSTAAPLLTAVKYSPARSLPTTGDQLSVGYTVSLENE